MMTQPNCCRFFLFLLSVAVYSAGTSAEEERRSIGLFQWSGKANSSGCQAAVALKPAQKQAFLDFVSDPKNGIAEVYVDAWCYLNPNFQDSTTRRAAFAELIQTLAESKVSTQILYSDDVTVAAMPGTVQAAAIAAEFTQSLKPGQVRPTAFHLDLEVNNSDVNAFAVLIATLKGCREKLTGSGLTLVLDTDPQKSSTIFSFGGLKQQTRYSFLKEYDGLPYNRIYLAFVDRLVDMNYRNQVGGEDGLAARELPTAEIVRQVRPGSLTLAVEVGCSPKGNTRYCRRISFCGMGREALQKAFADVRKQMKANGNWSAFNRVPFAIHAYSDGSDPDYIKGLNKGQMCVDSVKK